MQRVLKLLRDNRGFLLFIFGMFVFRSAVADWYQIPSGSMEPTLQVGDRVFVDNRAFNLRVPFTNIHVLDYGAPRAGEVITFKSPVDGERLIKRVVAVAGQRVEANDGQLFVDDQAVPGHAGHIAFGPVLVPAGHVFVMGDHRDNSFDSRYWGPLPLANVYGRALMVVASLDGVVPRGDRWFLHLPEQAP